MRLVRPLVVLIAAFTASLAQAAEGLWTFEHLPLDRIAAETGFRPDGPWLATLREGTVRLSNGCTGARVSAAGLVATNEHCLISCLQGAGPVGHDAVAEGFIARRRPDEFRCPGLEGLVLVESRDVSQELATAGADAAAASARLESHACTGPAGTEHCEVVALFHGARYRLDRYRRYADVRLVFAPEFQAAFFGGNVDNYSFPRHCLDVAFLRLYEGGHPAATPRPLRWRHEPPRAGEALFLAGHPFATARSLTVAELEFERDVFLPTRQRVRAGLRHRLRRYASSGPAAALAAADALFDVENRYIAFEGRAQALADGRLIEARRADESRLRARLADDPTLAASAGDPWEEARRATERQAMLFPRYEFLEVRAGSVSSLFRDARLLVRAAAERELPAERRLPEYAPGRLEALERTVLEDHPVPMTVERLALEAWLTNAVAALGASSPEARELVGASDVPALAERLVRDTRLGDPAVRAALWQGGAPAIAASEDPLIRFVREGDASARAARRAYEEGVTAPLEDAALRIARVRYRLEGEAVPPDANGTLRLGWGRVEGVADAGAPAHPWTTFGELLAHAGTTPPFTLPPRWAAAHVDASLPLDFAARIDTVIGNSGAPLVDADGNVVGIAFDGNRASLGAEYGYDEARSRTVAVASAAVSHALRRVYGLAELARELESGR